MHPQVHTLYKFPLSRQHDDRGMVCPGSMRHPACSVLQDSVLPRRVVLRKNTNCNLCLPAIESIHSPFYQIHIVIQVGAMLLNIASIVVIFTYGNFNGDWTTTTVQL